MSSRELFTHFPEELKQRKQWLIAAPDKQPYTIENGAIVLAKWKKKPILLDFETALEWADRYSVGIGYLILESDDYACIDLDYKCIDNEPNPSKWTTDEQLARFKKIMEMFDSYSETSRSGYGVHIWVKGNIGPGVKRDGVEVYSRERFIICTGKTINAEPIGYYNDLLNVMAHEMRKGQFSGELDETGEEQYNDWSLYEMGINAKNGSKFHRLFEGDQTGYISQSEADYSLLSMIAYYSDNNEQCRRIFRASELGRREKALKNNRYIDYCLIGIRGRQYHEKRIQAEIEAQALKEQENDRPQSPHIRPKELPELEASSKPITQSDGNVDIDWPPGLVGWLAKEIYATSARPVKEVSIVTALGFMAGVCGRAYNIPQSGLNLYIVLVARSGVGKEAMHVGMSKIVDAVVARQPAASKFVDFSDYASGQALSKGISENPSIINVQGEFGKQMRRLASDGDGPVASLRKAMTNLYQKSASGTIVGGISYSKKESNIASVTGVSYSMIGETTPDTFYGCLNETMMEDGFLSRFLIVEYQGKRPALNPNMSKPIDPELADKLEKICTHSLTLLGRLQTCYVQRSEEAAALLDAFELTCDAEINGPRSEEEHWRQMWNRASLKVRRISALLACGDHPYTPVIQAYHVEWALMIVKKDIAVMSLRINNGDIGSGDAARYYKLRGLIYDYLNKYPEKRRDCPWALWQNKIVTKSYLWSKVAKMRIFSDNRAGSKAGFEAALYSLIDHGEISEMNKKDLWETMHYHGTSYKVLHKEIME